MLTRSQERPGSKGLIGYRLPVLNIWFTKKVSGQSGLDSRVPIAVLVAQQYYCRTELSLEKRDTTTVARPAWEPN